eukprot:CAMPEP_0198214704 /NCGR_PEP_ID=MMETSP1445-20131203/43352_1 /TAXON_ID=36898 /ORGANISM="Pyramimonas sp., Strain CCMP2087" /LENGTH=123 /DNA_ID=CAMNT_0043890001 /DNA_START=726 /DNA_END=1093 /DNA_ORIENTATION=-
MRTGPVSNGGIGRANLALAKPTEDTGFAKTNQEASPGANEGGGASMSRLSHGYMPTPENASPATASSSLPIQDIGQLKNLQPQNTLQWSPGTLTLKYPPTGTHRRQHNTPLELTGDRVRPSLV